MDVAFYLTYFILVGFLFRKYKILRSSFLMQCIRYALPCVLLVLEIIFLGIYTPRSTEALVQKYVLNIAPEYGGKVVDVKVVNNQRVNKGDTLFILE